MSGDRTSEKLQEILFPYYRERASNVLGSNGRFCYYTSASTALSILEKKEVWLRNATLMNDFREVHHGQDCLHAAWTNEYIGGRLRHALDKIDGSLKQRLPEAFDAHQPIRQTRSFLLCVSEHGSESIDEDQLGRLSMWRAYGGATNVALVFHNGPFLRPSDALGAYTSPVLYADLTAFQSEFDKIVVNIENNIDFLKSAVDPEVIFHNLFQAFRMAVLSTKHPGFAEEREWRVIFCPDDVDKHPLSEDVVTVDGVPQTIFKLPLKNFPEDGFHGATLPELLDRIIIGPTQFPGAIHEVFCKALRRHGIEQPHQKIFTSNIPIRR